MLIKKRSYLSSVVFLLVLFCTPTSVLCSFTDTLNINENRNELSSFAAEYYNLYGKRMSDPNSGNRNNKIIVLSYSNNKNEIIQKIRQGHVISCPSTEVLTRLEEVFRSTEATEKEYYFSVGQKGAVSKVVEGSSGRISTENIAEAKRDLKKQNDLFLYDVHSHQLGLGVMGADSVYGGDFPSPRDLEARMTSPCVVLGYIRKEIHDNNTIGGQKQVQYIKGIGFYNSTGLLHTKDEIEFERFIDAVKRINRSK